MGSFSQDIQPVYGESTRLISWKCVADWLECDERTAKRWEKTRRLPVHRMPGGVRGLVFAYPAELERWLRPADPAEGADRAPYAEAEFSDDSASFQHQDSAGINS